MAYLSRNEPIADTGQNDEEELVVLDASRQVFRLEKSVVLEAEAKLVDSSVDFSVFHFIVC